MKIHFKLDGKSFKGTAEAIDKRDEVQYLVDLTDTYGKKTRFILCVGEEGNWKTDDIANPDIVYAAGSEIERYDEGYDEADLPPNNYSSNPVPGISQPVFRDGEIINEPEDVDEQTIS